MDFMENLLDDLGKAWATAKPSNQRLLISSIFDDFAWDYKDGFSNCTISPMFKPFRDNKIPISLSGELGTPQIEHLVGVMSNLGSVFKYDYQFVS